MTDFTTFKLVTPADAAAVLGVSVKTISNYIRDGLLPRPVRFGSRDYWHPAEFEAFLDRTFRRDTDGTQGEPGTPEAPVAAAQGAVVAIAPQARTKAASSRDSSAVVRQQARQREMLRALNRGT
jgi:predicted DNA-binding transcriptional regulator AlpA